MHEDFEQYHDESFEKLGELLKLLDNIPGTEFTVPGALSVVYGFKVSGKASTILKQSRTAGFTMQRIHIDHNNSELPGYGEYVVCTVVTSLPKIEFRKGYCYPASSNKGTIIKTSHSEVLFFLIEIDSNKPYDLVFDTNPAIASTIARLFIAKSIKKETIEKN